MDWTPSGPSDPGRSQEGLRDGRRVYNPKTDEWLTLATQEEADGLADAFEASEKADREFLFSDAARIAQISWGRWKQMEPLLEDFPTYPGPRPESMTKGHVIALARAMEGMDAALGYAQQAENEANAPRLFVPFYSFVEKAREGASMEEQQLAFAYGVGLMLDYLSLGTMSLVTEPAMVVESVAAREAVAAGEAAMDTAARTVRTAGRRGDAFRRFFYDAREYDTIRREYWRSRGPANGRSLHHWLFPQRDAKIPLGIRNAGFNLIEMPPFHGVFYRNLNANTWMGFARTWGGPRALRAANFEKGIRVGLPAAGGGVAYSGYKAGEWFENLFTERK